MTKLLDDLWESLPALLPFLGVVIAVIVGLTLLDRLTRRRSASLGAEPEFRRQLIMLGATIVAAVLVIVALPLSEELRIQILSLTGIAATAVLTISSTTFVSNALAGVMLRAMRTFAPGDFIRVGEDFGRVTERRLLHTEIQTEDRDLVTLPNFYVITKTVKVVRGSGTIISATVSIGYDVPHERVRALLVQAAEGSGLSDCFAQVLDLGDFSVTYRAAGFLADVGHFISARSALRIAMLDALHGAGVEIVSPTFMIQRAQSEQTQIIPEAGARQTVGEAVREQAPERIMFDKADLAGRIEALKKERDAISKDLETPEDSAAPEGAKAGMTQPALTRRARLEAIDAEIQQIEDELDEHK